MGNFANIDDYKSDEKAENDGIDLSFGNARFITITRAGSSNRKYKSVMGRLFKPHTKATGELSLSDDEANDLMKKVYAESIVVGWRGFKDESKKDIPFSKENCFELFTVSPEIFDIVREQSAKFSNFARGEAQDSGKE